ncbi:hypothetical protein F5J12DRAFT_784992 [Pisolithus orientalis]|uniref:uncharacterized protein n=1 Tax=Pisolithus orientalis TaxID=936130 RepID=UPI00222525D7|nr:uncharacterized protein F5J12DRAFT_784992 [Pisolithus orientalis]KAI5998422.1 hypothetical protein F5J12DRAFT_784992 [Pisolithus orientalis]
MDQQALQALMVGLEIAVQATCIGPCLHDLYPLVSNIEQVFDWLSGLVKPQSFSSCELTGEGPLRQPTVGGTLEHVQEGAGRAGDAWAVNRSRRVPREGFRTDYLAG